MGTKLGTVPKQESKSPEDSEKKNQSEKKSEQRPQIKYPAVTERKKAGKCRRRIFNQ